MDLDCTKCRLSTTRRKIVLGEGPIPARVMLIGEGPGFEENNTGSPFVYWAKAGKELNRLLTYLSLLDRADIYVTNTVKCHCPNDRDPKPDEILACAPNLHEEIDQVDPEFIITVGAISSHNLLGPVDMEAVHGIPFEVEIRGRTRVVVPCYHPAAGLRSPDYLFKCQNDFYAVGRIVKGKIPRSHLIDPLAGCEQYNEITDPVRVKELLDSETVVAVDTETVNTWVEVSGRSGGRCKVITPWCVQFSAFPGTGYMVRATSTEALLELKRQLENPNKLLLIHNALFDLPVLEDLDIRPTRFADTMSMAYLLQSEPQGLKPLAFRYWGMKMMSYEDMTQYAAERKGLAYLRDAVTYNWPNCAPVINMKGAEPKLRKPTNMKKRIQRILNDYEKKPTETDIWARWHKIKEEEGRDMVESCLGTMPEGTLADIPFEEAVWYACRDVDATIRVYPHLWQRIQDYGLEETFWRDMRCMPMVADYGKFGILPDVEKADALSWVFLTKQMALYEKITALAGRKVNLNSNPDVKKLLYEDLKLRKVKKGSTGAKALAMLKNDHLIVPMIKQWKEYDKLRGTYTSRIQTFVGVDGRIHPTFRITRVPTGRLACSKPNLMAQPVRNEEARAVRDCYVTESGFTFVSMDFSQIEMRDLAHVSQDPMLLKIFREGLDIHAQTAAAMFRIPVDQVDEKKHRYPAKRVGFGIVYGITALGLWEQFFMAGLDMTYWTVERCQELIDLWYGVYQGVKAYMQETGREARQHGFTRDQFGRIRWVTTIYSSDEKLAAEAERQAGNNPIQSGAQQIIKEAMGLLVPVYRAFWEPGCYTIRPLIQIHDDLVFEVRDDLLPVFIPMMKTIMENAIRLDVPIEVDVKVGKRWGSLKKWEG